MPDERLTWMWHLAVALEAAQIAIGLVADTPRARSGRRRTPRTS